MNNQRFEDIVSRLLILREEPQDVTVAMVDALKSDLAELLEETRRSAMARQEYRDVPDTLMVHVAVAWQLAGRHSDDAKEEQAKVVLWDSTRVDGVESIGRIFKEPYGFSSTLFVSRDDPSEAEKVARHALTQVLEAAIREPGSPCRSFSIRELSWMDESAPLIIPTRGR